MEKLVEEILNELKLQKETLNRIQGQLEVNRLPKSVILPVLPQSAIPFHLVKDNLKEYCILTLSDIAFTRQKKYVMGFAGILNTLFSQFDKDKCPIQILSKQKKTFVLKEKDSWSTDSIINISLFDELVALLVIHLLNSVYRIQAEGSIQTEEATKIINQVLKVKKEINFAKNIRYRFIGMYADSSAV